MVDEKIIVVIIRIEIMLGDIVVAVYLDDDRYKYLYGKIVRYLLVDRVFSIVVDSFVDMAFGIGKESYVLVKNVELF